MEYSIEKKQEINLVEMVRQLKRQSANETANDWKEASGDVWNTLDEFINTGIDEKLACRYKLYREPMWQMGFTKTLDISRTN